MKKIKLIYCLILSIFLVGCSVNYNVNITEDSVEESFEFTETDSSKWDTVLFPHTDITYKSSVMENANWPTGSFYQRGGNPYEPIKIEGVEYYNQELINDNKALGLRYNYNFKLSDYNGSNAVRSCFKNFSFGNGDKQIKIYANNASYCFQTRKMLDKVKITLTSSYKVVEHNADKVEKEKYIWIIKEKDASKKKIEMTLTKDKDYVAKDKGSVRNSSFLAIIIVIGIFIVLVGGTALYLYTKNKKLNKF